MNIRVTVSMDKDAAAGYELYQGGRPVTECKTDRQRTGWHLAESYHNDWLRVEAHVLAKDE